MKKKTDGKAKRDPIIGKEIWLLTTTGDECETITTAHSSWRKALNAARLEFSEHDLMEHWERAKDSLRETWFFQDHGLMEGMKFLIDCVKVN